MRVFVLLVLLAFAVLITIPTHHDVGPARAEHPCAIPYLYGDISGNGSVESADATLVLREVARLWPHTTCPVDPDCDGGIDTVDALIILRYVAGLPYTQDEPCPDIGAVLPD